MKIYLASFYSPDLKRSASRFVTQAKQMKVYDFIKTFTFDDLNEDFKFYVTDLIKKGKKRGYGYWVWQTYIHQLVLSKLRMEIYIIGVILVVISTGGKKSGRLY